MLYRAMKAEELIETDKTEQKFVDIMENNNAHLKIGYLKKNAETEPHMSHTDVCIYVTDGELEITFSHAADCTCTACSCALPKENNFETKTFKIKKDELFLFEKNTVHHIKALKDSVFLKIKI